MSFVTLPEALARVRSTLDEQEDLLRNRGDAPSEEINSKANLIKKARFALRALEDFLDKILVAPGNDGSVEAQFKGAFEANDMTRLVTSFSGVIGSISSMRTADEFYALELQLKSAQDRILENELMLVKSAARTTVLEDEVRAIKAELTASKKARAEDRALAALYETVVLCEESIWAAGRAQGLVNGPKSSLQAISLFPEYESMKQLGASLLHHDVKDMRTVAAAAEKIKEVRRPHGHVANEEIKWTKGKLEALAEAHLPTDTRPYFSEMLEYLSRAAEGSQFGDQPLLAAYLALKKRFPEPL